MAHSRECRREAVEVGLCDRVELVIVAASAIYGEPEEGLPDGADEVFEFILPGDDPHLVVAQNRIVNRGNEEPGGLHGFGIVGAQHVASELQPRELVVRHVRVQRANDPVAVGPGIWAHTVAFEAIGLAITNDIEPVPRPALAVVRRREQPVHDLFVGNGTFVLEEFGEFFRRRRQADQIESDAAKQYSLLGRRRR